MTDQRRADSCRLPHRAVQRKMTDICEATGAKKLLLHSCHNVSKMISKTAPRIFPDGTECRRTKGGSELMALLTCSDVTFSYEGIPVLTDVNFALEAGSPLYCGRERFRKSTLVKGLLHLKIRPPARSQPRRASSKARSAICRQTAAQRISRRASGSRAVRPVRPPHFRRFTQRQTKRTRSCNMELLDLLPLKKRCYRDLS